MSEQNPGAILDLERAARIGLTEAVFCEHKSVEQISDILFQLRELATPALLTRLDTEKSIRLPETLRKDLDFDGLSRTAFFTGPLRARQHTPVAIVSGGTSDAPVCLEASRTLEFHGVGAVLFQDVGITGLWRLLERIDEIRRFSVVIAVAGMEGALFSVLGGLIGAPIIAVPTSVGYGVARGGRLSLNAALSSCAPGLLTANIDNGYGAACAALRVLNNRER